MNQLSDPLGVRRRNKNEKLVILLVQVEQILARLGNKKKAETLATVGYVQP